MVYFKQLKAISKLRRVTEYSKNVQTINALCESNVQTQLKKKVLTGLLQFVTLPDNLASRKARHFRR